MAVDRRAAEVEVGGWLWFGYWLEAELGCGRE